MTAAKRSCPSAAVESLERQDLAPGWDDEIARRILAVERGESRLIPGAEVVARVRKALRRA